MPAFHFLHPGDLATRTGGYRYAREVLSALSRRGITPEVHRLADSFPFPDAQALAEADRVLGGIPDESVLVVDGLALGAVPVQVAAHARRLKIVALVHHPLALESGLSAEAAAGLAVSERDALAAVRAVIVTSPATAAALRDYDVPRDRITVILPGTDRVRARHGRAPGPVRLLCVASITPRKGHLDLVEALGACRARNPALAWHLLCVGSLERDPGCTARVVDRIRALGLDGLVTLAGERDEAGVERAYAEADVFVLASHYEGYGMVLAEAMAHGLPIVSTRAGAIPDTVPAGAGLLVDPGDTAGLAAALEQVIASQAVREAMAAAASRAAADLPDWDAAAALFIRVLTPLQQEAGDEPLSDALTFSASWLALREPHDHAARADALTRQLCRFLRPGPAGAAGRPLGVLDLACGSGSSLRYLAPRLGGDQHWRMIDRDPALLASIPAEAQPMLLIDRLCLDLVEGLDALPLEGIDLITASALLDLVSADWFDRLLAVVLASAPRRLPPRGLPALLFALSYDGSMAWQPALPDDALAAALFNRHQRSDKGFGPALGPAAADEVALRLQAAGFTVTQASSPWRLGPGDTAIQREFIAGIAGAAATLEPGSPRLQTWLEQRLALVDRGQSIVEVGHQDVLALPPGAAV